MNLPKHLQEAIEKLVEQEKPSPQDQSFLTKQYKKKKDSSQVFKEDRILSLYLATRCPPIYGVLEQIFTKMKEQYEGLSFKSLIDLGAGPGTAVWAALSLFPEISSVDLYEQNEKIFKAGKNIERNASFERPFRWHKSALENLEDFPSADLAILSYSIGELKDPLSFTEKLWKADVKNILIVEPGEPRGFELLRKIRSFLISQNAQVLAPCTHMEKCPMEGGDWCHFSARVERSRVHKHLKKGSLGYEDEKYSYLFVSKERNVNQLYSRVLAPPLKRKGHVKFKLCRQGRVEEKTFSKKDLLYKELKKADWGDFI